MARELLIVAPKLLNSSFNEIESFGSATWLWMHSQNHREIPLYMLSKLLLPAIMNKQFILIYENKKPIFFLSWAEMNEVSEKKYLSHLFTELTGNDWVSGDRTWIMDLVAPFGHVRSAVSYLKGHLLKDFIGRSLYHRSDEKGHKIKLLSGHNVTKQQAQQWQAQRPLAIDLDSLKGL